MTRIPMLRYFSLIVLAAALLALAPAGGAQAQASQRCFAETGLCIERAHPRVLGAERRPAGVRLADHRRSSRANYRGQDLAGTVVRAQPAGAAPRERAALRCAARPRWAPIRLAAAGPRLVHVPQKPRHRRRLPLLPARPATMSAAMILTATGTPTAWSSTASSGNSDEREPGAVRPAAQRAATETLSDGQQYTVQWFERARFELHPENAAPIMCCWACWATRCAPAARPRPPLRRRPTPAPMCPTRSMRASGPVSASMQGEVSRSIYLASRRTSQSASG